MNNLQTIGIFVGVVTGSTALILSILNFLRDRAILHVGISVNMIVRNVAQYSEDKTYGVVEVINVGRRPAFISTVVLLFPDGQNAVLNDIFFNPKSTKEGEEPRQFLFEQETIHQLSKQWAGVYCLVRTSAGTQFRSRFLNVQPTGCSSIGWFRKRKLRFQSIYRNRWALKSKLLH